ncbi:hypothetical protein IGB42_03942 [Andreprevotia sp. IGB-42]|nr:hypothetical protein IGB42_03942 [Andreprevotia sp. IGB-42]
MPLGDNTFGCYLADDPVGFIVEVERAVGIDDLPGCIRVLQADLGFSDIATFVVEGALQRAGHNLHITRHIDVGRLTQLGDLPADLVVRELGNTLFLQARCLDGADAIAEGVILILVLDLLASRPHGQRLFQQLAVTVVTIGVGAVGTVGGRRLLAKGVVADGVGEVALGAIGLHHVYGRAGNAQVARIVLIREHEIGRIGAGIGRGKCAIATCRVNLYRDAGIQRTHDAVDVNTLAHHVAKRIIAIGGQETAAINALRKLTFGIVIFIRCLAIQIDQPHYIAEGVVIDLRLATELIGDTSEATQFVKALCHAQCSPDGCIPADLIGIGRQTACCTFRNSPRRVRGEQRVIARIQNRHAVAQGVQRVFGHAHIGSAVGAGFADQPACRVVVVMRGNGISGAIGLDAVHDQATCIVDIAGLHASSIGLCEYATGRIVTGTIDQIIGACGIGAQLSQTDRCAIDGAEATGKRLGGIAECRRALAQLIKLVFGQVAFGVDSGILSARAVIGEIAGPVLACGGNGGHGERCGIDGGRQCDALLVLRA